MNAKKLLLSAFVFTFVLAGFTLADGQPDAVPPAHEALQATGEAASWAVDPVHSKVGFKARHFGISNVRGEFQDYEAAIHFDVDDLSTLEASVQIKAASVFTGNERRDGHLRSDDFFNAEVDSIITFTSTGVRNIDGNEFDLVGDLTIRGNTHEVVLEAEFLGSVSMERGEQTQTRAAFEAQTKVNRMKYGLKFDRTAGGAGDLVVGDEVTLIIELELIKQAV